METVLESDPLTEFLSAVKNPNTRRIYTKDLKRFFDHLEIEGDFKQQAKLFVTQAQNDPKWAMLQINSYIQFHKERVERGEIAEARVANMFKPIRLFCEENDIVLNWRKLSRRVPKGKRAANDRAPELQEIKMILSYPDRRIKPAVLIMLSSGCRLGAFDYLDWGDIEPIEKNGVLVAAKIRIYKGTNDEYFSFVTPECYRAIKAYMDYRAQEGEKITKSSPLIRDLIKGERWGKGEPHIPFRLKSSGVKRLIEDALKVMGIRGKLEEGKRRHEFQADHGFRKFFKSQCERKMKSLHVEILLGHNVGLADNYYRPQESELLEEYLKAVPDLTILEPKASSEAVSEDIAALKREIEELRQTVQFATRQNITKEIRSCLRNYFSAISQEEKQRQKARLLQGFGFTEEEIEEIERLHNAVYEELKIPSHVKDKETYLSEQFRRIGERPRLKELFTEYFTKINEVTERVYQMTKSRTSGHANFFEFAKEGISELFP
jgi:hypothetical protein